ncbi:MAG: SufD family Fe-S cluster assembly protein [Puniceicoccales bacterium]|nr:SufD family Fe-S cluster assembly protein [Puniceicoccales bacterium]
MEKNHVLFGFCVQAGGSLGVDFRPEENREISIQLILEEKAEATVRILYHGRGVSTFTCHTCQRHMGNNSQSTVLVRCVCEDSARVDYHGKIEIPKEVIGVRAIQEHKNLVFSENVCIHTEPAMNVHSKDAECFHGAAIGGIDTDVLQYFFMRGMERPLAQECYIAGFLN